MTHNVIPFLIAEVDGAFSFAWIILDEWQVDDRRGWKIKQISLREQEEGDSKLMMAAWHEIDYVMIFQHPMCEKQKRVFAQNLGL